MSGLVLDASVVTRWATREDGPFASRVEGLLSQSGWWATAPPLLGFEVANALVSLERRTSLADSFDGAWQIANAWLDSVRTDSPPLSALKTTCGLALQHQLTAYDAAYLELALRRGLPLATLDHKLRAAAVKAGVQVDF